MSNHDFAFGAASSVDATIALLTLEPLDLLPLTKAIKGDLVAILSLFKVTVTGTDMCSIA